MHNREFIEENETHQLLWDFEIQTDHQISARWLYVVKVNKVKIKESRTKYKLKKAKREISTYSLLENYWKNMEHEGNGDIEYGWCNWDNPQRIGKGTE